VDLYVGSTKCEEAIGFVPIEDRLNESFGVCLRKKNSACVAVKKDPCVGSTEEQEELVCRVKIRVSDRFEVNVGRPFLSSLKLE